MINWKVRIKSKTFWIAIIPCAILLIEEVAQLFGVSLDLAFIDEQLRSIVDTVFVLLAILGVVVDPTTKGIADSAQALNYTEPK